MSLNITDKFIDSLYGLMDIEFPESSIKQAKKCLLDYLGVTFAGARMLKDKGSGLLDFLESGGESIPVLGFKKKGNIFTAALINGMSAHVAELDDGVRQGSIHLGAPIISALLVLAQEKNLSGNDLIRGIIVGYEAAVRVAITIQPSHRNKGFHTTGTCGAIGVTIGASAALGFSKQQMKNALSAVATNTSGMLKVTKGSSELKPFNAGQAAVSGLIATLIARTGFIGSDDVLDGDWGLLKMLSDTINTDLLIRNSSDVLWIEKVYMKPYAACRHAHPAIEAAIDLKKTHNIIHSQIKSIKVQTYQLAVGGHDHTFITNVNSAKMSTPFSVAIALITGKAGIMEFTENTIQNNEIITLTKKVCIEMNDELNKLVPAKRPAIVEISLNNGVKYSKRVDLAKGEPEKPLSDVELLDKFMSLSLFGGIQNKTALEIADAVKGIENNIKDLINKL